MPRYRLLIEYDGAAFLGWQRQETGLPSVQGAIETAAAVLNDGIAPLVHGAGRTDSGVHASGQVGHLDLDRVIGGQNLRDALNFHLKDMPVVILEASPVRETFHARFSATARHYRYRILNRRAPPALDLGRVWHVPHLLDAGAMQAAADVLAGTHDFSSFRATECQAKSPVKTLDRLKVERAGDEIHVYADARSFLHNQVRIMVGTLRLAGDGRWSPADVAAALAARDRVAAGPTAPAQGLVLTGVDYDDWGD
ncbi:tRNA pseudouridine(38-40) synthase TruA [Zavarzinia compransoris]|uniref:tRNA pseudouridine synthase A n=1 Tax=Zavarzinia compransoris TaxID=1264899 RepID=A0A317DWB9_9PROT|nr:tRNA pseudouridine(38-40) synthase TruA [Zavarzinia compransoris]PWR18712.1 tRNA pseudouridine(38-40) synthase TruA [Zavarzinia compransoris]TDP48691.1 tRNA pseudouridine38-40 synthase [Zavarzinia compransoris]